jgi:hypothetical protein
LIYNEYGTWPLRISQGKLHARLRKIPASRAGIEVKWAKFRRALRREDQLHFDRLLRSVRYYTPSAAYQCSDDPRDSVMVSILLDSEKRLAEIEEKLKLTDTDEEREDAQLPFADGDG